MAHPVSEHERHRYAGICRADRHGLPADAAYPGDVDDRFDADPVCPLVVGAALLLLLSWYLLHHVITLLRYLLIRSYRHANPVPAAAPLWARRFVIGTSAAGLIWATVRDRPLSTTG
jgi:hypothetical protein